MSDMAWVGSPRELTSPDESVRSLGAVTGGGAPEPAPAAPPARAPELGRTLRVLDLVAVAVAVLFAWTVDGDGVAISSRILLGTITVGATLFAIEAHGLYRARACAVRSVELVGLARAAAIGAVVVVVAGRCIDITVVASALGAAVVTFLALAAARGGFVAWLRRARTQGRYSRSIVIVGSAAEAERLVWLLRRHPELGLRPVGLVGEDGEQGAIDGVPWLGGIETVVATLSLVGANGVMIASADLDAAELNATVRTLLAAGVHVQLSNGLWGIDHQRLRPLPLADVTSVNQRAGGPLFKATNDPRRTKVGRILETTSLDELPQLVNVLRGDMSLVGPRPALPHEVAEFDDELLGRQRVLPGITGLWQVEGRENPAFDVYRRLDLFYVENWSVGFDLAILMSTFQSVLMRLLWRSMKTELTVTAELGAPTP